MDVCFVLLTRARVSLGVNDARIMMAPMHGWRRRVDREGRCTSSAAPRRQHGIHAHGKLRDRIAGARPRKSSRLSAVGSRGPVRPKAGFWF